MGFSTATDSSSKICATCQYWCGERKVCFYTSRNIRVLYNNSLNECNAWRQKRNGAFSCNRYKRWVELP